MPLRALLIPIGAIVLPGAARDPGGRRARGLAYTRGQLIFAAIASLALWSVFVRSCPDAARLELH